MLIATFYCITFTKLMSADLIDKLVYDKLCIYLVMSSWGLCFGISIFSNLTKATEKLKSCFIKYRKNTMTSNKIHPHKEECYNTKIENDLDD